MSEENERIHGEEETKGRKKWLLLILLLFVLAAGGAGIYALTRGSGDRTGESTTAETPVETTAAPTETAPEPEPTETETETEPVKTAGDELRERLAAEGEDAIELTEDVEVSGDTLIVNGTKTLTGSGTIAGKGITGDYIITIAEGAALTIDGPVIDGRGKAKNGILVSKEASLDFESGRLTELDKLGIRIAGEAMIKGELENVGTYWVFLQSGGKAAIDGAVMSGCGEVGLQVLSDAELIIQGDASFSGAEGNLFYNRGTATVVDAVFSDSGLYGISNGGIMTLKNVEVSKASSQGLVYNYPDCSLEMTDCTLHESQNYLMYNSGTAVLDNVTFEESDSHAIYNEGETADLTVRNSSFDKIGSTALFNKVGSRMTLENVTVVSNGNHALYNRAGQVTAKNFTSTSSVGTIVCNDSATDTDLRYGSIELDGFTLSGGPGYGISCYGGTMNIKNGTVDVCGSYGLFAKAGTVTVENVTFKGTSDKEGRATVQIGLADAETAVVTMTNVNITGGARGIGNHGTLIFQSGTIYGNRNFGKINYGGGIYNFNKLTVNGGTISGNETAKSGGGIYNAGTMTMNGGTVTGNKSESSGGGIYNAGTLVINGGTVTGNRTATSGGGIANKEGCSTTLNWGTVSKNEAENYGGGIYNRGSFVMNGGTVTGNTCGKIGAGIHNAGVFRMANGTVDGNVSATQGGGLYNTADGTMTLSGGVISNNKSGGEKGGGGVYNTGRLTVEKTVSFRNNRAASVGGAILNSATSQGAWGTLTVTGGSFEGNSAASSGGAIYSSSGLSLSGGSFTNNKAGNNGGAVYAASDSEITVSGGSFDGNTAGNYGGTLYLVTKGSISGITVKNSSCQGGNGGAVYVTSAADISLSGSTITDCTAPEKGPAIYVYKGKLTIENSTMTAKGAVPAIWNNGGELTLGGKNTLSVYTQTVMALKDNFASSSSVTVYLDAYTDGREVLRGSSPVLEASYDKAFVLPELPENMTLKNDGRLSDVNAKEEAVLYDETGKELARGSLVAMIDRAESGQTIELIADAEVSSKQTIGKDLTIRDDGTPRTIFISSLERGFQTDNEAVLRLEGKGGLTVAAAEGLTFPTVAVYVIRGTLETEGKVTVSGFNCDNTAQYNTNGAAIYVASSGKLKLNGTELSGNTSAANGAAIYIYGGSAELTDLTASGNTAGKGDDIYLANGGSLTVRGGSLTSGGMADPALYVSNGTVTLDKQPTISLYTGAAAALAKDFSASSEVTIYLDEYTDGRAVVTGDSAVVKAAVAGGAFLLPALPDGFTLAENGRLSETPLAKPEAILYDASGAKLAEGRFTAMVAQAEAGQIIELVDDITLASTVRINKAVTIRDDGEARTIYIGDAAARGLEFYGDSGIEESAYPTVTLSGSANGGLTVRAKNPDNTFGYVAIYVIRAKLIVSGNVTVTDYKTNNSVTNNKNGGAFNIASSGTLEADGLTVTGITASAKGAAIYNNGGRVVLKNVTFADNTSSTGQDVYIGSGSLILGGKSVLKVYTPNETALTDDFDAASEVSLYLDAYTDGKTVLTGTASVVAAAVDGGAITLPEAADQPTETKLLSDGTLSVAVPTSPEAILYDADGTKLAEGLFTAMVAQAEAGQTVELVDDITIASTVRINKAITIRDDGTARTIYIGDAAARGLEFYGDSGIEESAYPTVTLSGSANGGLTVRAKNPDNTFGYVAIYVIRAKLIVSENVTVTDYKTNNSVTNNKNGGAFNIASSGTLEADGLTVTNITASAKGAAIYNNGGKVVLKNVTFADNTSSTGQDVYIGSGSLTLGGKSVLKVYTPNETALTDDFDAASEVSLYLDAYTDGKVVLTGTASVVAAAVDGGAFTLPEAADQPTETKLLSDGTLSVAEPTSPEAILYDADGTKLAEGTFAEMLSQAEDGQIIELVDDITLLAKVLASGKSVTIRDDGEPRTITVATSLISKDRAFQTGNGYSLSLIGQGGLTITTEDPSVQTGYVGIYVVSGVLNVSGPVTVSGFNCSDTVNNNKHGAAIYVASSGQANLTGTTLSGNTAALESAGLYNYGGTVTLTNVTAAGNTSGSGQDVYNTNNGTMIINGGSFASGSGSSTSVYINNGSLTLDGQITVDIFTKIPAALADDFDAASEVSLYLDAYTDGKVVLTGTASVVAAAVDGGAVTLPEAADQPTETKLLSDGTLSVAEPTSPEAALYDTDGTTKLAEGLFTEMVEQAQAGQTVQINEDITLTAAVRINKDLTIRDNGEARTIYIDDGAQRGLEAYGDSGIAANAYPTIILSGSAAGGLTIRAKNPDTTFKYVAIYVIRAKLIVSGNVTVTDYKTDNSASNNKNGGAISLASSGTLEADGLSVTNVSAAAKGAAIYSNGGAVTLRNVTFGGNSSSGNQDVTMSSGDLILGAKVTASVYTAGAALADDFDAASKVTLYLDTYEENKVVLTGTDEVISSAIPAFELPELTDEMKLALQWVEGTGAVLVSTADPDPEPEPEPEPDPIPETGDVEVYDAEGSLVWQGTLKEVLAYVQEREISGAKLVLTADITVDTTMNLTAGITLTDDGTARTITVTGTETLFEIPADESASVIGEGGITICPAEGTSLTRAAVYVNKTAELTLKNVSITGFTNTSDLTYGAALYTAGNAILDNVVINGNTASGGKSGAALYIASNGSVAMNGGVLSNNSVTGTDVNGGAVYVSGKAELTDVVLSGNAATKNGGAIYMGTGSVVSLTGCTLENNTASSGPGIYNYRGALTLKDTTVTASGNGIYVAVNGANGTLAVDGTVTARVSFGADIPVQVLSDFSAGSSIRLTRKTYVAGDAAITGDASVLAATYTAFSLNKSGFAVGEDGLIVEVP